MAVNESTHKAYVINTLSDSVSVLDGGAHVLATIKTGAGPEGIAVSIAPLIAFTTPTPRTAPAPSSTAPRTPSV